MTVDAVWHRSVLLFNSQHADNNVVDKASLHSISISLYENRTHEKMKTQVVRSKPPVWFPDPS